MDYKHAPVSEVIFGVTFSNLRLETNDVLGAQQRLQTDFPNTEIRPPLADELLDHFNLQSELDPQKSGPFQLRLRSSDRKWICQLQSNKVYLNWVRADEEEVGNYPGFTAIYNRFQGILNSLGLAIDETNDIGYFDLSYHDRFEWQSRIKSVSDLGQILNFEPPRIKTPAGFNNVFSKYTYDCPSIGGFGIIAINTDTSSADTQLLKFESSLRGVVLDKSMNEWFDDAHELQYSHFTQAFRDDLLRSWE